MSKKEYMEYLRQKCYKILNDNQVALGSLVFDVKEADAKMIDGKQCRFCLAFANEK